MSNPSIVFTSLGLVVLDEIRLPSLNPLANVLGGSGVYATLGARLFLPAPESKSLGWMIRVGYDFSDQVHDELAGWDTTLIVKKELENPSTRGLLEYEDTTFGPKKFQYTTSILPVENEWLERSALLASNAFHFLEGPEVLETRVSAILSMRVKAGITELPLIIWEPAPLSCKPENYTACLKAVRIVDVFSPNHLELLALCGKPSTPVFNRSEIEVLAQEFLEGGIGHEGAGIIIVRAAEYGSLIKSHSTAPTWIPSYYEFGPGAKRDPKVVDPTGAGNAFLGAYAIGFLKTGDSVKAACYGSIGASFALEQVGPPKKSNEEGKELWNGADVASRLDEFISKLSDV